MESGGQISTSSPPSKTCVRATARNSWTMSAYSGGPLGFLFPTRKKDFTHVLRLMQGSIPRPYRPIPRPVLKACLGCVPVGRQCKCRGWPIAWSYCDSYNWPNIKKVIYDPTDPILSFISLLRKKGNGHILRATLKNMVQMKYKIEFFQPLSTGKELPQTSHILKVCSSIYTYPRAAFAQTDMHRHFPVGKDRCRFASINNNNK